MGQEVLEESIILVRSLKRSVRAKLWAVFNSKRFGEEVIGQEQKRLKTQITRMLQNRVDISFSWVYGEQKSLKENGKIMFKKIAIFIFVFAILCVNVYAHSGGTDWRGGHNDNSTGGYHYHHGYPEHQHPNGICPYDDRHSDYSSEEEDDYEEEVAIVEKEEKRKEEAETNKYIWIYTIIGLSITLTSLLSIFKDSYKMNRETKEPIYIFLISALVILAIAIFAYWILYSISFRLSQSLFKDDVVVTHICANIPTFFMIYYAIKGRKKGE